MKPAERPLIWSSVIMPPTAMTRTTPPSTDESAAPPSWQAAGREVSNSRLLLGSGGELTPAQLHERRERVFIVLAGIFLGSLAMLNILGVTRFVHLGQWGEVAFVMAVGVLPYPITFLCTDLISEIYGRRRANFVVFVGLLVNLWVMFILWLGGVLPGFEETVNGELAQDDAGRLPVFFEVRQLAFAAVTASMIAYIAAQFCDVYMFHFWKRLTRGRHLWLRNNGSTLVSQLVDTTAVILITFAVGGLDDAINPDVAIATQLMVFIATGYAIKVGVALFDTIPAYVAVHYLSRYLRVDPRAEHHADAEESAMMG